MKLFLQNSICKPIFLCDDFLVRITGDNTAWFTANNFCKMQIIYYILYNLPESFHDDVFVAKNMKYDSCGPYKILAGEQINLFTVAI